MPLNSQKSNSYCLSSCIVNHLQEFNIKISEHDLYCNENMLDIKLNEYGSLESPVENKIIDNCKRLGLELKKLSNNDISFLDNLISKNAKIILNVDIKNLKYSKFYENGTGDLTRHYINIISGERGTYHILDPYIPTIPLSSFEGLYNLSNPIINNSTIYLIQVNRLVLIKSMERKSNVIASIDSYFSLIENNDPYQLLIKSIEDNFDNSKKLYEIVVSLAVGGILASREFFHKNVFEVISENNKIELDFQEIQANYFKLRLLIIKLSFSKSIKDLDSVRKKIREIKKNEISTYQSIKILLKEQSK